MSGRQAHRDRVAAHNVTGSSRVLTPDKVGRLPQDERTRQPHAVVRLGKGTPTGRQASLTPAQKRTALLHAIG
jgi:hypothetical protein